MSDKKAASAELLERIHRNIEETDPLVAREDLKAIIDAMVVLFVDSEPRLISADETEKMKIALFFSSLLKLAGQGMACAARQAFREDPNDPFLKKIGGFTNLKDTLMRYSK